MPSVENLTSLRGPSLEQSRYRANFPIEWTFRCALFRFCTNVATSIPPRQRRPTSLPLKKKKGELETLKWKGLKQAWKILRAWKERQSIVLLTPQKKNSEVGVLKSGLLCGAPKCTGTVCVCKGTVLFAYVGICLRRVLCDNEWNKGPKVTSRPITFSFKDIFYCLEGAWTDRTSFLVSPFLFRFSYIILPRSKKET